MNAQSKQSLEILLFYEHNETFVIRHFNEFDILNK